jgi:excisionase family DNA binding protein
MAQWLTFEEVAAYLKMGKSTIYTLARTGHLPAHRAGKAWRFDADERDYWIKAGGLEPEALKNPSAPSATASIRWTRLPARAMKPATNLRTLEMRRTGQNSRPHPSHSRNRYLTGLRPETNRVLMSNLTALRTATNRVPPPAPPSRGPGER